MDLVIVESPTKAKTLSKFLGSNYKVVASLGHVSDLPKSKLGIDVEHDFKPDYIVPLKARPTVKMLKEEAAKAKEIWLSTDPDREGEAIAWHVARVLQNGQLTIDNGKKRKGRTPGDKNSQFSILNSQLFKRAVFHEITKSAVDEAFEHPRELDMNLVNSQQARRILDRLVGYKLSPLLWKKVAGRLSAGRVQSIAVRLIVERERERRAFVHREYWSITAVLSDGKKNQETFEAKLLQKDGEKLEIGSGQKAREIEADLRVSKYSVKDIKKEEKNRYPSPPFTTSTLQQAAGNRLGFSASRTMKAAQGLYENGHITYMRTDSVNLSEQFLSQASNFIKNEFGPAYAPTQPIRYKTKSRLAQEAHEAIRPTRLELGSKNQELSGDEARIYELIYSRALASQMTPAVFETMTVDVLAQKSETKTQNYLLRATGSVPKFDGFLRAFGSKIKGQKSESETGAEIADEDRKLPELKINQDLHLVDLKPEQHFTEPPARFTEASLVKALEEDGIGRPSTYAPIISTIQNRGYVAREGRYLFPADIGFVVNDLLVSNFPKIVDIGFTSQMEEELDLIAEGKKEWVPMVRTFYVPFEELVLEKEKELQKQDFTTLEKLDEKCPECGKELIVKIGRFGKFISCSGFPECKFTKPLSSNGTEEKVDESQLGKCPKDGGNLVIKRGRFGQFVACENYPTCKFTKPYLSKIGVKCPQCGMGDVIIKRSSKGRTFYGCSRYPECKYASWTKPGELKEADSKESAPPDSN